MHHLKKVWRTSSRSDSVSYMNQQPRCFSYWFEVFTFFLIMNRTVGKFCFEREKEREKSVLHVFTTFNTPVWTKLYYSNLGYIGEGTPDTPGISQYLINPGVFFFEVILFLVICSLKSTISQYLLRKKLNIHTTSSFVIWNIT